MKVFLKKYKLLLKIAVAISLGFLIGTFLPYEITEFFIAVNIIISKLLNFSIPLIIIAFVTKGISSLESSGKMLGIATCISYVFMICAAFFSYFTSTNLFPNFLTDIPNNIFESISMPTGSVFSQLSQINVPPIMDVVPALILAFILGIGISSIKGIYIKEIFNEFHEIINLMVQKLIVPILPVYILGIFAKMTASGQVFKILLVFSKVFIVIIALHIITLFVQYFIAGIVAQKNPFKLLKNIIPAYLSAIATQSSVAVIPITIDCSKKNGVSSNIADFVLPLCSTIHLSGSVISITACSVAVMLVSGKPIDFASMVPFMMILGVMMVAAPGVPCGAILAASGILQSILGFDSSMLSLIIALHVAQDGFGTACNVSGDGSIAVILDTLSQKVAKNKKV
ncbi:transporter dicarboxylate/amino acid:cation Na+/H+ symporter family protein [Clostridium sp. CAG:557]|jgi:Na+/H+-dicarboxylate symporter|nr:transporter dicarboxylate/amino acid:cation Na+/H+ symporter family protein [Clostridium sp. CAG:557]